MKTFSLCMIVKNEEKVLKRCLDSLKGLFEEIIIVDTGSTDNTEKIAAEYTDKIYHFEWIDDFAAARNYAMSLATCDYIYMADADEILDEENRNKFLILKEALVDEIEIVQMQYANQMDNSTVYNFDCEYRAKLYKRVRNFTFIDPVHEVVRTEPLVYDSDIVIIHKPEGMHGSRDIRIFEKTIKEKHTLSKRLITMYAKELLICATDEQLLNAYDFFIGMATEPEGYESEDLRVAYIVLARIALAKDDCELLMTYALKEVASPGSSEVCSILGNFYEKHGNYNEARLWYYNAAFETQPVLSVKYKDDIPFEGLIRICERLNEHEEASNYKALYEARKSNE